MLRLLRGGGSSTPSAARWPVSFDLLSLLSFPWFISLSFDLLSLSFDLLSLSFDLLSLSFDLLSLSFDLLSLSFDLLFLPLM